jgi:hypothetical protein
MVQCATGIYGRALRCTRVDEVSQTTPGNILCFEKYLQGSTLGSYRLPHIKRGTPLSWADTHLQHTKIVDTSDAIVTFNINPELVQTRIDSP